MTIQVNFSGVNDDDVGGGGGAPPGEYVCKVIQAEERTTKDGSASFLNFGLQIIEGEHEGKLAGYDKLFFHTDNSQKRSKFVLRRLGFDVDNPQLAIDAEQMNERKVLVKTQLTPKCPECKWDAVPGKKDEDGNVLFKCKKDDCGWQGREEDVLSYTAPKYNGYEALDEEEIGAGSGASGGGGSKASGAADTKDIPF